MYCGVPDSGLAVFLASGDTETDSVQAQTGPDVRLMMLINALAVLCLGVITSWS